MDGVAREFSDALNREITYADINPEKWEEGLKKTGLPEHLTRHLLTIGELHRAGRYDRQTDGVQ
jgi:NAD(P)H dehydrogenase (quinone)